uniref:Uncharacterized protein n=1 Tax=Fagus sylvatica TaxID=28930 RepID=A0A2N9HQH8_FAGSY
MGGCASKPKESDIQKELLPNDDSAISQKAEGETVAQESKNGGENQSEAPLVDLSESKEETKEEGKDLSSEPKTAEAAPVSVEAGEEIAKATEDKVEAPAKTTEEKVEAGNETQKAVEDQAESKADKPVAAPSSEDKIDAPLVTV